MVGNRQYATELLVRAIKDGDWVSAQEFVAYLSDDQNQGGSQQERYAVGQVINGQRLSQPSMIHGIEGLEAWPGRPRVQQDAPVDRMRGFGMPAAIRGTGITEAQVVDVNRAGGVEKSNLDSVGIVKSRSGYWTDVTVVGPAYVRIDSNEWSGSYDELWLSPDVEGAATSQMPRSARDGMVLIGRRIGAVRNGAVEAAVHPPVFPASWWRVWEYDSSNYVDLEHIAIRGGFWRMIYRLAGKTVGILMESGFSILGHVYELPYTADTNDPPNRSRNGEIEYAASGSLNGLPAVCFGIPHSGTGTYTRIAELDSKGDLRVGELFETGAVEPAVTSADFGGLPYKWNTGQTSLDLSLDRVGAWMRFVRTVTGSPVNARFEVPEVIEGVLP